MIRSFIGFKPPPRQSASESLERAFQAIVREGKPVEDYVREEAAILRVDPVISNVHANTDIRH